LLSFSRIIGVSDIGFSSQNSDNSEPVAKKKEQELKIIEENVNPDIASTEQVLLLFFTHFLCNGAFSAF
jgi:hypothetical protein